MRNFILYSRGGQTSANFRNLREAGRLDIVAHCLTSSFFISHALRKDVIFHIILTGPPSPPKYIRVDGSILHDVRCDEATWGDILKIILSGKEHPGFTMENKSFQEVVKELSKDNEVYVLEEKGELIQDLKFSENCVFVIGDQVGLPKKEEGFVLRYGKKISLGKKAYLAADCITILNYTLDSK
jgi:tRNA (pseudouridine54-N1)-methyltransferase